MAPASSATRSRTRNGIGVSGVSTNVPPGKPAAMHGASTARERRAVPASRTPTREGHGSAGDAPPILEPRPHGVAAGVSRRLSSWHPAAVFAVSIVAGYLVLAALAIGWGLLLVHVLLPFHGLG